MSISSADQKESSGRIVVGVDGSASSKAALQWAVTQSRLTGQPVEAVMSWDYPVNYTVAALGTFEWAGNATLALENAVNDVVKADDSVHVRQRVEQGHAARVLLDAARDAGLVVVGSRGHGGFTGLLLGSVSQHVVTHAHCPVVVVHAPAVTHGTTEA